MKKIMKIILIGCILLGLAFFVLIKNSKGTTPVLALSTNINTGQVITENMLQIKDVPNSAVPNNAITKKADILGKTLSVSRLKGDYIPKDIVKKVNIELKNDEVVFSLRIPKDDVKLIQEGGELALSLLSGNNTEPLLVKGIYVMAINTITTQENSGEEPSDLVIVKAPELIGNKIAPYVKTKNYKILVLPQDTNNITTPVNKVNTDKGKNAK